MRKVRALALAVLCSSFFSCPGPVALKTGTLTVANGTGRVVVDVGWAGFKLGGSTFAEVSAGKVVYLRGIAPDQDYTGPVYAGTGYVTFRFQNDPGVRRSAAVTVPENGAATVSLR